MNLLIRCVLFLTCFIITREINARSSYLSHFYIGQEHYITEGYGSPIQISGQLRIEQEEPEFQTRLDLGAGGSLSRLSSHYILVPQAYVNIKLFEQWQFYIGRKIIPWNAAESEWNLDLWQPHFMWDPLSSVEEGLTGVFIKIPFNHSHVILFASPFFIPGQSPPFKLQDGEFISDNPWFISPLKEVVYSGEILKLHYDLKTPAPQDVIKHISFGALWSCGNDQEGWFFQTATLLKPRSFFAFPFEHDRLDIDNLTEVNIKIFPTVVYHQISGLDVSYRSYRSYFWFSSLIDKPINSEDLLKYKSHPQFNVLNLWSIGAAYDWNSYWNTAITFIQSWGGDVNLISDLSNAEVFQNIVPWKRALRLMMEAQFWRDSSQRLNGRLKITNDLGNEGTILSAEVSYQPSPNWIWDLSVDFLGTAESAPKNTFVSRYGDNDRIYGGVHYVF